MLERVRSIRWCSWPVLAGVVTAIVVVRLHELLLHPTLRVEDGANVFSHFYVHRDPGELFRFKSGYLPLLPNILGYLSVRLPVTLSPYFLTIVPTLLSIAAYTAFFAAPFRALVPDDRARFLGCAAVALAPVGQFMLVSHSDYSIWTALFLALLWALVPFPGRPGPALATFSAEQLLIWTSPVSFVLAPIHGYHLLRASDRRQRAFQLAMLIGHALHFRFGLEGPRSGLALTRLTEPDSFFDPASVAYRLLTGRVLFEAIFGAGSASWSRTHLPGLVTLWTVLLLAGLALALARPSPQAARRLFVFLAYAMVALTLAAAFTRFNLHKRIPQRYAYVQALCQVLFAYLLGLRFVVPALARILTRWPRFRVSPLAVYGASVLSLFALESPSRAAAYRDSVPENAGVVQSCMRKIARYEAKTGGPCGFSLTCTKRRDWAIKIRAPECPKRR